jgi:hypothetical protein
MTRMRRIAGYYLWALVGCPPFGLLAAGLLGGLAALPLLVGVPAGLAIVGARVLAVRQRHAVVGAIGAVVVAVGEVAALFAVADYE